MPLLIIEILSPKQAVNDIIEKFEIYLKFGILSCWLVIPPTKTITIFNDIHKPVSYSTGIVVDPILKKEIDIKNVFK